MMIGGTEQVLAFGSVRVMNSLERSDIKILLFSVSVLLSPDFGIGTRSRLPVFFSEPM